MSGCMGGAENLCEASAIAKYERFLGMSLLCSTKKVITDSGGLQKEAYFTKVPALVMMPDTSWIKLIETSWNVLVDADAQKIKDAAFRHEPSVCSFSELYGSGDAGEKIVEIISSQLL